MRRLFWFALGAMLGAWAMHKLTRLTRNFTPRGVTARAAGVGERLRSYAADIRAEMTAREAELWSMLRADSLQETGSLPETGTLRETGSLQGGGAWHEGAPDGAAPERHQSEAARGRHVRTAATRTSARTSGRMPDRPPGRPPGRAPNGKVLDDDKDGH